MFKNLAYDVTFSTGRHLAADVSFSKGMTAVYGHNESGKSFMLEMMRFGLFGTAALRSSADSYESLTMSETFDVRGVSYKVDRTLKRATLVLLLADGEATIATGVTAVNEKIVSILGFGLQVFDVACAATQNNLLQLTQMRPTERKRMVDTTIGVGMLEVVAKWARDEAVLVERHMKTVEAGLRAPVEPVQPEGYTHSARLRPALQMAQEAQREADKIQGALSLPLLKPTRPECSIPIPASALKPMADERRKVRSDLQALQSFLKHIPESIQFTDEQLAELKKDHSMFQDWEQAQRFKAQNPRPVISRDDCQGQLAQWENYENYQTAVEKVESLREKLSHDQTQCPSCEHIWHSNPEAEEKIRGQLKFWETVAETPIAKPLNDKRSLNSAVSFYAQFSDEDYERHTSAPEAQKPALTMFQINEHLALNQSFAKRAITLEAIRSLEAQLTGPDMELQYETRARFERDLAEYDRLAESYVKLVDERARLSLRFEEIKDDVARVGPLTQQLQDAVMHEHALVTYEREQGVYEKALIQLQGDALEAEQYRAIAAAMVTLRMRIKQHLLPSLNRVSSQLLARMTAGSRNTILIDDDFNITVDGQSVETLSGSGQACTNLALRIALGQVLVSSVFSVFLGDEIDGSMDGVRAKETAETLRNLAKVVSQVVVISHKSVEADQEIVFGDHNELATDPGSL